MMAMKEAPEVPGYLRVAGAAVFLSRLLVLMLLWTNDLPGWWFALTVVFVVGGLGLLLGRRWGWPLSFLEAIVNIASVTFQVTSGRANPALTTFSLLVIPCLVLWALLTPRSLAWLRGYARLARPASA